MNKVKLPLFVIASICIFLSCAKGKVEEGQTCEDTNTTKVTYSNTTSAALRVVVSATLTPQLDPINPVLTIDLAPGQSVMKEFQADRYAVTWYNGCPATCNRRTYYFRDFNQCETYDEKQ
jgi:hypothetical protein